MKTKDISRVKLLLNNRLTYSASVNQIIFITPKETRELFSVEKSMIDLYIVQQKQVIIKKKLLIK
ncbi:MAG: hypothetical protein ACP5UN_01860 [Candidatus Micrarchaeia archaeon]